VVLTSSSPLVSLTIPHTSTSLLCAICHHSCVPRKTSRSVTHPKIAIGQARLTQRFFRGRLLKKKKHLVDMTTLLILLSLGDGYHHPLVPNYHKDSRSGFYYGSICPIPSIRRSATLFRWNERVYQILIGTVHGRINNQDHSPLPTMVWARRCPTLRWRLTDVPRICPPSALIKNLRSATQRDSKGG
jgi:hypothetical protein